MPTPPHVDSSDGTPTLRFVELPPPVMTALLAGDLARASELCGVRLTDYFVTDDAAWLWRLRLGQVAQDPQSARWIVRVAVTEPDGQVVGHCGFHGPPDEAGMVEVGYGVDPEFRRRGYARAMLRELLRRAAAEADVRTVRASIRPDNTASLATIAGHGFVHVGEQSDEEDGLEHLYEVSVKD